MLTVALCSASAVAQTDYVVVDLLTVNGGTNVKAHGINSHGEVVGEVTINNETQAFVWLPDPAYGMPAGMNLLDDTMSGFESSIAFDINDAGIVVGGAEFNPGGGTDLYPYIWDLSGTFGSTHVDLFQRVAYDINDDANPIVVGGELIQTSSPICVELAAFEYDVNAAQTTVLQSDDPSNTEPVARGVSDTDGSGDRFIVGLASTPVPGPICNNDNCSTEVDGQYWDMSIMADPMESLGTYSNGEPSLGVGHALNDDHLAVGASRDPDDVFGQTEVCRWRAVVWNGMNGVSDPPTRLERIDEGDPEPVDEDEAFDIAGTASSGPIEIVGYSRAVNEALLWREDGSTYELIQLNNTKISCSAGIFTKLRRATGVNDSGLICGWGTNVHGIRAFLLIPSGDYNCPADLANGSPNGSSTCPDGVVNVFDLLALLGTWGTDGLGANLDAPIDEVDVFDLLVLLGDWGVCGIGNPPDPLTLEEELDDAGLTTDDWHEFEDVMTNSIDEDEKDNYRCWMENYLTGCVVCPPCPDEDPFGR